jgi:hypothetical protein
MPTPIWIISLITVVVAPFLENYRGRQLSSLNPAPSTTEASIFNFELNLIRSFYLPLNRKRRVRTTRKTPKSLNVANFTAVRHGIVLANFDTQILQNSHNRAEVRDGSSSDPSALGTRLKAGAQ